MSNNSTDSEHIPRPMNCFMLFRRDFVASRKELAKAGTPDSEAGEASEAPPAEGQGHVSKLAGPAWANASAETKAYYKKLADEENAKHQQQYPHYKFSPQKKGGPGKANARKDETPPRESGGPSRSPKRFRTDPGASPYRAGHSSRSPSGASSAGGSSSPPAYMSTTNGSLTPAQVDVARAAYASIGAQFPIAIPRLVQMPADNGLYNGRFGNGTISSSSSSPALYLPQDQFCNDEFAPPLPMSGQDSAHLHQELVSGDVEVDIFNYQPLSNGSHESIPCDLALDEGCSVQEIDPYLLDEYGLDPHVWASFFPDNAVPNEFDNVEVHVPQVYGPGEASHASATNYRPLVPSTRNNIKPPGQYLPWPFLNRDFYGPSAMSPPTDPIDISRMSSQRQQTVPPSSRNPSGRTTTRHSQTESEFNSSPFYVDYYGRSF